MSDLEEVVTLERINLIARLSTGCDCQSNDKDIALVWIAELAGLTIAEILSSASVNKPKQNGFTYCEKIDD